MTRLLFDIETDGLLNEVTKIHCIVILDLDSGELKLYDDPQSITNSVEFGLVQLQAATTLKGHNILSYDIPVIKKLYKLDLFSGKEIIDTQVCSEHMWLNLKDKDFAWRREHPEYPSNLLGKHSLEAWGHRLGEHKGSFGKTSDWKVYTKEMGEYCKQDVMVNKKLLDLIDSKNYPPKALEIEHNFKFLMVQQQLHGFAFNRQAAVELYGKLSQIRNDLEKKLKEACGGWYEEMKTPDYFVMVYEGKEHQLPTKGACDSLRKSLRLKPKDVVITPGPNKKKHTEFNPGSHDHIARFLIEKYAWKPLEFGNDGKPSTTEEILEQLPYPEIKLICEYLMIEKRIGQLAEGNNAWLKLETDGRMHGKVNTNGAVSTRVTHVSPNMSQVPAVDKPFGKECRALFTADKGHVLVGADASGIQLRALAHYMSNWDNGEYGKIVLSGDIHTANQQAAGFATRDMAKTFIYAFLLGAGPGKVGSIAGTNKTHGQQLIDSFLSKFPALKALKEAINHKVKTQGYILGLDGRILPCRSEHAALSSLLQGFEACIMKHANWLLYKKLLSLGLKHGTDFAQTGFFHDEIQTSCKEMWSEVVGKESVAAITQAGINLNSQCPLTGEYRVGGNWCETH